MSEGSYRVSSAAPEQVEKELLRIWRDNLPVGDRVQRKFDWIYRDAPVAPDRVFLLHAGEDAVGTAGIGVRRFQVGNQLTRAALLVDLAVDREHRSLLPALRLVRAAREHILGGYGLAYGFPNKYAVGVFKRAGYKRLGAFPRYVRVLRHQRYLDRIAEMPRVPAAFARVLELPYASGLIGRAVDVGRVVVDSPRIAGATARFRLHTSDAPDERIDRVWDDARGDYGVVAERSARFARWRFADEDCTYYYLCDRGGAARPRAYAITSVRGPELLVWDMFGRVEYLGPLIDAIIPRALRTPARTMILRFLGDPRVVEVLASRGFREAEAARSVLYDAGTLGGQRSIIDEVGSWYLLDADEDE